MSTRRRWPSRVYGTGSEPDARFSLANERTFLAWVRTALALLAGAAALDALDLPMDDTLQGLLAALLAIASLLTAAASWWGWARVERAMREQRPLPSNPAMVVVVVSVALAGVAIGLSSLVRGAGS